MYIKPTDTDWIHWSNLACAPIVQAKAPEPKPAEPSKPPKQVLNEDCEGCRGEFMVYQGGCSTCTQCGWSKCDG